MKRILIGMLFLLPLVAAQAGCRVCRPACCGCSQEADSVTYSEIPATVVASREVESSFSPRATSSAAPAVERVPLSDAAPPIPVPEEP